MAKHERSRRRSLPFFIAAGVLAALMALSSFALNHFSGDAQAGAASGPENDTGSDGPNGSIRNVVMVLADDLDWKAWAQIPRLAALQAEGTTFTNFVATDSLCCPARTSILRGQYVHNHRVLSNVVQSGGGWQTYERLGYPQDCLPVWLQRHGVSTGLIGKYLNGYPDGIAQTAGPQAGWDYFVTPVSHAEDYTGYNYRLDDNGTLEPHGTLPTDFLNDVLDAKATEFLRTRATPFFLEFASFNPHVPSPVAPRNVGSHPGAKVPRDSEYLATPTGQPGWLSGLPPFTKAELAALDTEWQQRLESAESIADSVENIRRTLAETGHTDDTLIVVTSDNGYHVGTRGLLKGKRTPYAADTVTPMVMIGPGITPGATITAMTSEIDLAPTIGAALGATTPNWVDGRDLWPLVNSGGKANWRTGVLSENLGVAVLGDPDYQRIAPPKYTALRTERWLYVELETGEVELYDRRTDPSELNNIAATAPAELRARLSAQLRALQTCAGSSCRSADSLTTE